MGFTFLHEKRPLDVLTLLVNCPVRTKSSLRCPADLMPASKQRIEGKLTPTTILPYVTYAMRQSDVIWFLIVKVLPKLIEIKNVNEESLYVIYKEEKG